MTFEEAQKAAKQTVINLLILRNHIGDLDHINKFVKVQAFVNSELGFNKQPIVINTASELLEKIFGRKGRHALSTIDS